MSHENEPLSLNYTPFVAWSTDRLTFQQEEPTCPGIACKLTFGHYSQREPEDFFEAAVAYVMALVHNGQIAERWVYATQAEELVFYVQSMGPRALEEKYLSVLGRCSLEAVLDCFEQPPRWEILDDNPPKREMVWKNAPFFIFHTQEGQFGPPLVRAGNGKRVPAYLLPISDELRSSIFCDQREYKAHDHLWIRSGKLEMAAYRELADPRSELMEGIRFTCEDVEAATGIPTYTFLMRYYGRRGEAERQRKCPLCGGVWSELAPGTRFALRCEPCRLITELGDEANAKWAKIGE